jgi:lipopolysaccharide exporter
MVAEQPRQKSAPHNDTLGDRLIVGATWMIGMRWGVRLIGMVNTLVLVRLLAPSDFGLVAMAMVVVAFVNAFNDMGLDMALIRAPNLQESHYHTAWTISLTFGSLNACVLLVMAPHVAAFFEDSRLTAVIIAMAALLFINSFNNPRLADFRRDFEFSKDFSYHLLSRLMSLPISISLAFYFQNYWALIAGTLFQAVVSLALSYYMRPFRPHLSFSAARELFGFSLWVQVRSVGLTLSNRIDQLFVGKFLSARELGGYQVMQEISDVATNEIVMPLGRALLPGYSRMQDDQNRLRSLFFKILGIHAILGIALAGGLWAISGDLVPLLLGEKWSEFAYLFQILVLSGGITAVSSSMGPVLVALNKVRVLAIYKWLQLGLTIIGLLIIGIFSGGLLHIAFLKTLVALINLFMLLGVTLRSINGTIRTTAMTMLRPVLSAILMIAVIGALQTTLTHTGWMRLLIEILLGGATFVVSIIAIWAAFGYPDGAERELVIRTRRFICMGLARATRKNQE